MKLHPTRLPALPPVSLLASIERLEDKRMKAFANCDRLAPTCADKYYYPRRARYWLRTARRLWDKQERMLANKVI
jgi:hypothetical protein